LPILQEQNIRLASLDIILLCKQEAALYHYAPLAIASNLLQQLWIWHLEIMAFVPRRWQRTSLPIGQNIPLTLDQIGGEGIICHGVDRDPEAGPVAVFGTVSR